MAKTLAQQILEKLAEQIVSGVLQPGQRLEEKTVAGQFGVSRTPVREALRLLSGTGLVEVWPHKGVVVAEINLERLADMFDAMGEFEGLCARLSARRMSALERQQLAVVMDKTEEAMLRGDLNDYAALNEQFHGLIYQGTHNVSLQQTISNFRQRLAPFRIPAFFEREERQRTAFAEHLEIYRAIAAGDDQRACDALRTHVASSNVSVIQHLSTLQFRNAPGPKPVAVGGARGGAARLRQV